MEKPFSIDKMEKTSFVEFLSSFFNCFPIGNLFLNRWKRYYALFSRKGKGYGIWDEWRTNKKDDNSIVFYCLFASGTFVLPIFSNLFYFVFVCDCNTVAIPFVISTAEWNDPSNFFLFLFNFLFAK